MCCLYYQAKLISNSLQEFSCVIPICADCVGVVVGATVEHKVTFMSSFSCIVGDSWFESEIVLMSQARGKLVHLDDRWKEW